MFITMVVFFSIQIYIVKNSDKALIKLPQDYFIATHKHFFYLSSRQTDYFRYSILVIRLFVE